MSSGPEKQPNNEPAVQEEKHGVARRAFLSGSLAAGPFILSVASRPAWAGCGEWSSGSLSASYDATTTTCFGYPAHYWRTNPQMVEQYCSPGLPNPTTYQNILHPESPLDYTFATMDELNAVKPKGNPEWRRARNYYRRQHERANFTYPEDIFGTKLSTCGFLTFEDDWTVVQALFRENLPLVCQSACAWLNASADPIGYGYDTDRVVNMCNQYSIEDPDRLLAVFTAMNNASGGV